MSTSAKPFHPTDMTKYSKFQHKIVTVTPAVDTLKYRNSADQLFCNAYDALRFECSKGENTGYPWMCGVLGVIMRCLNNSVLNTTQQQGLLFDLVDALATVKEVNAQTTEKIGG